MISLQPLLAVTAATLAVALVAGPAAPPRRGRHWVPPAGLIVTFVAVTSPTLGAVLLLAAVASAAGSVVWRLRRRRREAVRAGEQVLEACAVLTAELAAGQPATAALAQAAAGWPHLAPAARAAALGADVPASLRSLSLTAGAGDLALVAGAWAIAHHTGQGLTVALSEVMDDLRGLRETRRVVASELSSARATARLVAVLPVAVLAMGRGAGGDPIAFLVTQPIGWLCAGLGLLLLLGGLAWIEVIAGSLEADGGR